MSKNFSAKMIFSLPVHELCLTCNGYAISYCTLSIRINDMEIIYDIEGLSKALDSELLWHIVKIFTNPVA